MKTFFRTALIISVALGSSAIAPAAFAGESLEIRDFIGSINWSNGPMSVDIQKNAGDTKILGSSAITIDGGVKTIDGSDCKSSYGHFDIDWFGKKSKGRIGGFENLADYPVLAITLPADTKLVIRDSVVFTDGSPDISEADLDIRYCGRVSLGDVEYTLALSNRGSADVTMGRSGQIAASLNGSGDLTGGDTEDVLIDSRGSGDVELGDARSLEMNLHGSGDVEAGDVNGSVNLTSRGSGDVELNDVDGPLTYSGFGSGDLEVESVNGSLAYLKSHGSGDIYIGGGDVEGLKVVVLGSASVEYSGEARTADLSTSGSGDIRVDRVSGAAEIRSSGSGDIDIGERR